LRANRDVEAACHALCTCRSPARCSSPPDSMTSAVVRLRFRATGHTRCRRRRPSKFHPIPIRRAKTALSPSTSRISAWRRFDHGLL
jgi:hypothetical protein